MDWIGIIRRCFETDSVLYSGHARREMKQEEFGEIVEREVSEAIANCELLEEYPEDKPYPSALFFGMTKANRPIHVVSAYNAAAQQAIIVTVYEPDPERWENHRRRRT